MFYALLIVIITSSIFISLEWLAQNCYPWFLCRAARECWVPPRCPGHIDSRAYYTRCDRTCYHTSSVGSWGCSPRKGWPSLLYGWFWSVGRRCRGPRPSAPCCDWCLRSRSVGRSTRSSSRRWQPTLAGARSRSRTGWSRVACWRACWNLLLSWRPLIRIWDRCLNRGLHQYSDPPHGMWISYRDPIAIGRKLRPVWTRNMQRDVARCSCTGRRKSYRYRRTSDSIQGTTYNRSVDFSTQMPSHNTSEPSIPHTGRIGWTLSWSSGISNTVDS